MTLHLKPDGRVTFIHDYFNNDPIEETGGWKESRDRTTTIALTGLDKGRLYRKPDVITFRLVGDHLVAVKYDHYIHGYQGLRLKRTMPPLSASPMKQVEGRVRFKRGPRDQVDRRFCSRVRYGPLSTVPNR